MAHQFAEFRHSLGAMTLQLQHAFHERVDALCSCIFQHGFDAHASVGGKEIEVDFVSLSIAGGRAFFHENSCPGQRLRSSFTASVIFGRWRHDSIVVWKATRRPRRLNGLGSPSGVGTIAVSCLSIAGDYRKQQRQVFHVSRQRTDLPKCVEHPPRSGEMSRAWNAARGRLDGRDARAVGRKTHAAAGVASQSEGRATRRDDGGFAAAAASGRERQVIGIVRAAVNQIVRFPRPSHSGQLVFPSRIAPASRKRFTTTAS